MNLVPLYLAAGSQRPLVILRVYSKSMAEFRRHRTTVGWVGLLCLGIYWVARLAPETADRFALSSFGKLAVFGTLLAGVLLTAIAAVKGPKWWLVAVTASAVTLVDLYTHVSRVLR